LSERGRAGAAWLPLIVANVRIAASLADSRVLRVWMLTFVSMTAGVEAVRPA
jgi:hypothetical protein